MLVDRNRKAQINTPRSIIDIQLDEIRKYKKFDECLETLITFAGAYSYVEAVLDEYQKNGL